MKTENISKCIFYIIWKLLYWLLNNLSNAFSLLYFSKSLFILLSKVLNNYYCKLFEYIVVSYMIFYHSTVLKSLVSNDLNFYRPSMTLILYMNHMFLKEKHFYKLNRSVRQPLMNCSDKKTLTW